MPTLTTGTRKTIIRKSSDLHKLQKSLIVAGLLNEERRGGVSYLSWSNDAFPPPAKQEVWEFAESRRIVEFILRHTDLAWPPEGLNAKIESDNGRFRLWLEISENTKAKDILKNFSNLSAWKTLLSSFDNKPDPLPHPIPTFLEQIESHKQSVGAVAKQINAWIAKQMYEWGAANNSRRLQIHCDVAGVLIHFGFSNQRADIIMSKAAREIRGGRYPFPKKAKPNGDEGVMVPRDGHPVTRELLKSRLRTWRKKI